MGIVSERLRTNNSIGLNRTVGRGHLPQAQGGPSQRAPRAKNDCLSLFPPAHAGVL